MQHEQRPRILLKMHMHLHVYSSNSRSAGRKPSLHQFMLGLLISPLIVMFLLWLLARNEAELSYYIIFFVVAGVSILAFLATFASPWLGIAVYLIGLPFAIARFCYVSLPKAAVVTILFIVIQAAFNLAMRHVFSA